VGLQQCPTEKHGQGGPAHGHPVPSHVPIHSQTAANAAPLAHSVHNSLSETDSPLEQGGFELLVPLARIRSIFAEKKSLQVDQSGQNRPSVSKGDQRFESPSLQRGVARTPKVGATFLDPRAPIDQRMQADNGSDPGMALRHMLL